MIAHDDLDLVPLRDPAHVAPYHEIRRRWLFEHYTPNRVYDPDHAHEGSPQNLAHVLLYKGRVIGTLRIDLIDREHAGFRLVAVVPELRNAGAGGWMLGRAEAIAGAYGSRRIVINASKPAAAFYRRHGYCEGKWHDILPRDDSLNVRLGKVVTA